MQYTTITPKYQVHIPAAVRRQIGLVKHGRARVYAEGSKIVIDPTCESFLSLGGTFRVRKPILVEKIRERIVYGEKR